MSHRCSRFYQSVRCTIRARPGALASVILSSRVCYTRPAEPARARQCQSSVACSSRETISSVFFHYIAPWFHTIPDQEANYPFDLCGFFGKKSSKIFQKTTRNKKKLKDLEDCPGFKGHPVGVPKSRNARSAYWLPRSTSTEMRFIRTYGFISHIF